MRSDGTLRISEFSDREILAIMADLQDGSEEVRAGDLALRVFGIRETESSAEILDHAARCVTARLTWMRRYGLVEKGDDKGTWVASEWGKALRYTSLGRSLSAAITNTPEGSLMELTHQVSDRMLKAGDIPARAMRREVQHQITRRRWR
jgi:hypothetical protein